MDWPNLLTFMNNNIEMILAGTTLISFIINLVQRKTNNSAQHVFESIFHSCNRTRVDHYTKKEKTVDELLTIILLIRTQSSAGMQLLGSSIIYDPSTGIYDRPGLWGWFASTYRLLLKIRQKFPVLVTGKDDHDD